MVFHLNLVSSVVARSIDQVRSLMSWRTPGLYGLRPDKGYMGKEREKYSGCRSNDGTAKQLRSETYCEGFRSSLAP